MYKIRFAEQALAEMRALRAYDRKRVYQAIRDRLTHGPTTPTANLALLEPRSPKLTVYGPLWRLRVGDLRVYCRVFEEAILVLVLKVARTGRKTTEDVL